MSINKSIFIGNVGQDATVHPFTNSDKVAVQFSLAVTERWVNETGQEQGKTIWVRCVRYTKSSKLAEHIKKGDKLYVEGKIDVSAYIKEKDAVGTLELNVEKIDFLSAKNNSNSPAHPENTPPTNGGDDDDLPF